MSNQYFRIGIWCWAWCLIGLGDCWSQTDHAPHIIIIYTDDMGIGDVGYAGGQVYPTPNLDALAEGGKIFTQYYTTAPVCSPSRVALTTGMYHIRWNINTFLSSQKFNRSCQQSNYLSADAPSMARCLQEVGYRTAHIGKWHMGGGRDVNDAPAITAYGFDAYSSTWESPDPDPLLTSGDWIWRPTDSIKRWDRTGYFVDKTLAFLGQHQHSPCFINLWPDDVHTPWVPDEEVQADKKQWFRLPPLRPVLAEYDKQMGRLVAGLKALGIYENTLIIFTSDNGPAPSFDRLRSNGLRGVKNSLYEGGINMPCFVHWPAVIASGQVDSLSQLASIDWLPTICSIAGAPLPTEYPLDGEDMSRVLYGTKSYTRNRDLLWEYGRNDTYKFPQDTTDISPQLCIRHKQWKLLINPDGSDAELYDLSQDPTEKTNLAFTQKRIRKKLARTVINWYVQADQQYVSSAND